VAGYTVIIFLAQNGRTRAVKFRPKNFGRISFDLGEISPIQQILRLNNGRNSPKLGEIRPKFLRANLNCADSPISNKFRTLKTPVFEITSVLKYIRVEIFVLHNGKFCKEIFS
jgi:hypothetical protein